MKTKQKHSKLWFYQDISSFMVGGGRNITCFRKLKIRSTLKIRLYIYWESSYIYVHKSNTNFVTPNHIFVILRPKLTILLFHKNLLASFILHLLMRIKFVGFVEIKLANEFMRLESQLK